MEQPARSAVAASAEEVKKYCGDLIYKMNLTKGARFQSAKRHQKRSIASIWAVTILSMYVFSASTFLSIYDMNKFPDIEKPLIITNIIMSAFIIAFSVMEQGKKHDLKAELFLRCAQEIQELKDEIECYILENIISIEDVVNFVKRYNEIIHDFSDNHSEGDFVTYRVSIGKYDGQYIRNSLRYLAYWVDCWAIMLVAIFSPLLFLFAILAITR